MSGGRLKTPTGWQGLDFQRVMRGESVNEYDAPFHYGNYLRSERWKELRMEAVARAEGRCQVCGDREDINVHHRSYDRLGKDGEDRDLVVLCHVCHESFHFLIAKKQPNVRSQRRYEELPTIFPARSKRGRPPRLLHYYCSCSFCVSTKSRSAP